MQKTHKHRPPKGNSLNRWTKNKQKEKVGILSVQHIWTNRKKNPWKFLYINHLHKIWGNTTLVTQRVSNQKYVLTKLRQAYRGGLGGEDTENIIYIVLCKHTWNSSWTKQNPEQAGRGAGGKRMFNKIDPKVNQNVSKIIKEIKSIETYIPSHKWNIMLSHSTKWLSIQVHSTKYVWEVVTLIFYKIFQEIKKKRCYSQTDSVMLIYSKTRKWQHNIGTANLTQDHGGKTNLEEYKNENIS